MKRALVVGASGFVGAALVASLEARGVLVRQAARKPPPAVLKNPKIDFHALGDDFSRAQGAPAPSLFAGVDVVFYLAAATPRHLRGMNETARASALKQNAELPACFAKAARLSGVGHFIHLSSCGIHGEATGSEPITEHAGFVPHDAYVTSKIAAEEVLTLAKDDIPDLTIVRPPMVYGPGFVGPVWKLLQCVGRGIPLPLATLTHNRRKAIGLSNLAHVLCEIGSNTKARNEVFVVADNEELSTVEFLRLAGHAAGRSARLFPAPLRLIRSLLGSSDAGVKLNRLLGDYRIDDSKCRTLLNWTAPSSLAQELERIYRYQRS